MHTFLQFLFFLFAFLDKPFLNCHTADEKSSSFCLRTRVGETKKVKRFGFAFAPFLAIADCKTSKLY
jgi:hypothetical protein